jgi:hypothetical protein
VESPQTLVQTPARRDGDGADEPRRGPILARAPAREGTRGAGPEAPGSSASQGQEPSEQLLLGRYRLLSRLGAGGFGVVWRAHDELLQREVAVKRIWLGPDGDGDRAAREAQATARLAHPAIVALYEACALGEAFYLISELVPGPTLGALIRAGEVDDTQALQIGLDLLDALEHAHERGVVHRDIKPQNVLVPAERDPRRPGPAAKLTDFGGASIAEEDALTRTGDVLGTLAYMAPEQSEGREAAEPADLYALALVLYEALSGVNPVRGATPAATARRIGTRLEPLGRRRRDLPRRLTAAIDTALAPAPRERGEIHDLRVALQEALEETGGDTLPQPAPAARPRGEPPRRLPRRPPTSMPRRELDGSDAQRGEIEAARASEVPGIARGLCAALSLVALLWLCATGRAGLAVLLAAAFAPLALIPSERSGRVPAVWFGALLAPVLGLVGLAGAFPAVAGQAARWRQRFVLGALGYWWLVLAEPLLARRLWLGPHQGLPATASWEDSIAGTASHVVGPLLSSGTALGALLWGLAALVLPWLVRGAGAATDILGAVVWSAALFAAAPALDAGLGAGAHPLPSGAVLGAVLGGLIAVGARALRGPV